MAARPAPTLGSPKRLPKAWQTPVGHRRRLPFCLLDLQAEDARSRVLGSLSSDVSSALAETIEELLTYGTEFRTALQRTWMHVLSRLIARPEPLLFFHDAIPGFTALLFKKECPWREGVEAEGGLEEDAALAIVAQFVQRTGMKVRLLEGDDVLCVLFPVADLKKNLKEGGFYHTE